ncbi:hypothetical protein PCE1_001190 [Barthelona sp. PCE]
MSLQYNKDHILTLLRRTHSSKVSNRLNSEEQDYLNRVKSNLVSQEQWAQFEQQAYQMYLDRRRQKTQLQAPAACPTCGLNKGEIEAETKQYQEECDRLFDERDNMAADYEDRIRELEEQVAALSVKGVDATSRSVESGNDLHEFLNVLSSHGIAAETAEDALTTIDNLLQRVGEVKAVERTLRETKHTSSSLQLLVDDKDEELSDLNARVEDLSNELAVVVAEREDALADKEEAEVTLSELREEISAREAEGAMSLNDKLKRLQNRHSSFKKEIKRVLSGKDMLSPRVDPFERSLLKQIYDLVQEMKMKRDETPSTDDGLGSLERDVREAMSYLNDLEVDPDMRPIKATIKRLLANALGANISHDSAIAPIVASMNRVKREKANLKNSVRFLLDGIKQVKEENVRMRNVVVDMLEAYANKLVNVEMTLTQFFRYARFSNGFGASRVFNTFMYETGRSAVFESPKQISSVDDRSPNVDLGHVTVLRSRPIPVDPYEEEEEAQLEEVATTEASTNLLSQNATADLSIDDLAVTHLEPATTFDLKTITETPSAIKRATSDRDELEVIVRVKAHETKSIEVTDTCTVHLHDDMRDFQFATVLPPFTPTRELITEAIERDFLTLGDSCRVILLDGGRNSGKSYSLNGTSSDAGVFVSLIQRFFETVDETVYDLDVFVSCFDFNKSTVLHDVLRKDVTSINALEDVEVTQENVEQVFNEIQMTEQKEDFTRVVLTRFAGVNNATGATVMHTVIIIDPCKTHTFYSELHNCIHNLSNGLPPSIVNPLTDMITSQTKVTYVCHVNPENYDETKHCLQFAERLRSGK